MRPLLKWIPATCVLSLILAADRPATGQQLQWQHASQQRQRPAAQPAATSAPRRSTAVAKRSAAKPSAPAQPAQFKQPTAARPLASDGVGAAVERQARPPRRPATAARQPIRDRAVRPAMQQHYRLAQQTSPNGSQSEEPIGSESMVEELPPGEVIGPSTGPGMPSTCNCPDCQHGEPMFGEVYGEFVEPGCDVGYFTEPGCAAPPVDTFGYGPPACGAACGPECGDCCGEVVGGPACGCGECACHGPHYWPQSLLGCSERGCIPILWVPPIREIVMFGGVQGFKGPLDGDRDGGNFGFHEGFNLGGEMAWLPWPGLGYQFGYQATHSQLSGDSNTGTDSAHSQHFITAGLFQRQRKGMQYGVVWDMLRDERQEAQDFGQIRGEIGFKTRPTREIGFAFTTNSNKNLIDGRSLHAADQYLLYYRIHGRQGGEFRGFAGFTGDSNGVLGSEFQTPLTDRWSLQGNWRYLIPEGGTEGAGAREEAWNVSMQLVWHFGLRAKSWHTRPFRPMFDVADNASLMVVD